jgi:tRNA pseudouridine55 synthase
VPTLHFHFDRTTERAADLNAPDRQGQRHAGQGRLMKPVRARRRRALHGVLLLDKPLGWTSNDALQKAKGLLRAEKAGHTGTLDPLATGLLPLCFGAATKFSQVSLDADKRYRATLHLGQRTTTGDREGEVLDERPVTCRPRRIDAACARFTGAHIEQTPPMHSALKHQGRRCTNTPAPASRSNAPARSVSDSPHRHRRLAGSDPGDRRELQQGHLHPHAGRGHRRGAGLRRPPGGAAPHRPAGPLDVAQAVTIDALPALDEARRAPRCCRRPTCCCSTGRGAACPTTRPAAS